MYNKNLHILITALVAKIFEAEDRRLERDALSFVSENRALVPTAHDGFHFEGVLFTDLELKLQSKGVKGQVHPSLAQSVTDHLKDKKKVAFDRVRVRQALAMVLEECRTAQDIRDTLPNCLTEVFDQTRHLSRINPEAFTIQNNPRKLRQYHKLKELIEFYMITRLFY